VTKEAILNIIKELRQSRRKKMVKIRREDHGTEISNDVPKVTRRKIQRRSRSFAMDLTTTLPSLKRP
jgi:ribosome recycling factor